MKKVILFLMLPMLVGCITDRHEQFVRQDERFADQNMPRLVALLKMLGTLSDQQRTELKTAILGSGMQPGEKETAIKMVDAAGISAEPRPLDEFIDTASAHHEFIRREMDRIKRAD